MISIEHDDVQWTSCPLDMIMMSIDSDISGGTGTGHIAIVSVSLPWYFGKTSSAKSW